MFEAPDNFTIERSLQHPLSPIPPALLDAFYAYQLHHYRRFLLSVNLLGQAAYFSYGLADIIVMPDLAWLPVAVRVFLLVLTLPVVLALFRWSDNVRNLDIVLPLLIVIAAITWFEILASSTSPQTRIYQYAGLIFIVLANLCIQVRFLPALAISLLITVVILNGAYRLDHRQDDMLLFSLAYFPMLFFSLFISWSTTLVRRRTFLRKVLADRGRLALSQAVAQEQRMMATYVRFGAMISHEFRNPLGILGSQLSLIRKEQARGVLNLDKRLEIMGSTIRRLETLFDTWLQSDRLKTATQTMHPQRIVLQPWLEQLVDDAHHMLAEHSIALRFSPQAETVLADEQLLTIAVGNLIENACKYSPPGTSILIETRTRPGQTGIAISDHGPGIAPADQSEIFEPYYRLASDRPTPGMGLGLPSVKEIIQTHGGVVELDSTVGQGSTFCIWLPAGRDGNEQR